MTQVSRSPRLKSYDQTSLRRNEFVVSSPVTSLVVSFAFMITNCVTEPGDVDPKYYTNEQYNRCLVKANTLPNQDSVSGSELEPIEFPVIFYTVPKFEFEGIEEYEDEDSLADPLLHVAQVEYLLKDASKVFYEDNGLPVQMSLYDHKLLDESVDIQRLRERDKDYLKKLKKDLSSKHPGYLVILYLPFTSKAVDGDGYVGGTYDTYNGIIYLYDAINKAPRDFVTNSSIMYRTLAHEFAHFLGINHIHEKTTVCPSSLSYLSDSVSDDCLGDTINHDLLEGVYQDPNTCEVLQSGSGDLLDPGVDVRSSFYNIVGYNSSRHMDDCRPGISTDQKQLVECLLPFFAIGKPWGWTQAHSPIYTPYEVSLGCGEFDTFQQVMDAVVDKPNVIVSVCSGRYALAYEHPFTSKVSDVRVVQNHTSLVVKPQSAEDEVVFTFDATKAGVERLGSALSFRVLGDDNSIVIQDVTFDGESDLRNAPEMFLNFNGVENLVLSGVTFLNQKDINLFVRYSFVELVDTVVSTSTHTHVFEFDGSRIESSGMVFKNSVLPVSSVFRFFGAYNDTGTSIPTIYTGDLTMQNVIGRSEDENSTGLYCIGYDETAGDVRGNVAYIPLADGTYFIDVDTSDSTCTSN